MLSTTGELREIVALSAAVCVNVGETHPTTANAVRMNFWRDGADFMGNLL
jgi:hydroxyethylthiazole kinase-like sugar kinase family protein